MYERFSSFSDYIKLYGLGRSEGLLLRHLSQVYRVLENTVPPEFKADSVKEAVTYFEHILRQVDSSLLDEWEKLRNTDYQAVILGEVPETTGPIDITRSKTDFTRLVRNEVFSVVRMLASRQFEEMVDRYDLRALFEDSETVRYPDMELEKIMNPFYESRKWIRLDPEARSKENTLIEESEDSSVWTVRQTLVDGEGMNDWEVVFEVNIDKTRAAGELVVAITGMGLIGAN